MPPPGGPFQPGDPQQMGGEPGKRGPARALIIGLAVVLVLGIGGGAYAGLRWWYGSGKQPDEVLPGSAIGYVRVDLNPTGQQKAAIFNFARKFPELDKRLGSGDDPREALFNAIKSEEEELSDVDYAADIEPWLGNRVGVAFLKPAKNGDDPEVAMALEVTDQDAAAEGIEKLRTGDDEINYVFDDSGSYAIFAEDKAAAEKYAAEGAESPLSESQTYADDMDALGQEGVMSFWFDAKTLAAATGDAAEELSGGMSFAQPGDLGRLAGAVRFEGNYAEFAGVQRGAKLPLELPDAQGTKLGELPETTAVGLSIAGAGPMLGLNWQKIVDQVNAVPGAKEQFELGVEMAKQQFQLSIPEDIQTLLGDELTLAADSEGLEEFLAAVETGDLQTLPKVGLRSTTDVAKAKQVLGKLDSALTSQGVQLPYGTADGNGAVAVATDDSYAEELIKGGALGESELFKSAVADPAKSQFAVFVDLNKLEPLYLENLGEDKANVEPLAAIGYSGSASTDGATFSLRVVVD